MEECIRTANTKVKESLHSKIKDIVDSNNMTYKDVNTAIVDSIYILMDLNIIECSCSNCKNIAELRDAIYHIIAESDLNRSDAIRILEEIRLDYHAMMIVQSIFRRAKDSKPQPSIYL